MSSFSSLTVLISALISVLTGYVGALLSTSWQRRQDRRTYGLALLAEVRSIRRGLMRYQQQVERLLQAWPVDADERRCAEGRHLAWRHDTTVFVLSSARVGLFSPVLAVSIVEFYSRIRWLDNFARQANRTDISASDPHSERWLRQHLHAIRLVRRHSRLLSHALRRETPAMACDLVWTHRRRRLMRGRGTLRALHLHAPEGDGPPV